MRITLPLHILKDREGNWADSFECPYPAASEVTEGDTPEFTYVTDEEANTATLTNYKEVTAGQAGFVEFSYTTTKSTLDYVDMAISEQPDSTLEITKEDGTPLEPELKKTSDKAEAVAVNTHAGDPVDEEEYADLLQYMAGFLGKHGEAGRGRKV